MDIQMPELTGLELSKKIPIISQIIFTTAFDQYAIESYKVNAIGYLLKPFNYSEFLEAVEKVQKIRISPIAENQQQINYMFIKSDYKQFKINYDDIIYIEGLKDYVKIYLTSQATPILTLLSLKKTDRTIPF